MELDDYSFELHQECVVSATPSASVTLPFTYPHIVTLLTSNSLLSMMIASLASVIQLSLTYPHVTDEAQLNNHQASYLVSIRLILVLHLPRNFCHKTRTAIGFSQNLSTFNFYEQLKHDTRSLR